MRILILEDDLRRREAMQACLKDRFPQFPIDFFDSAKTLIEHSERCGLDDVILIALDHDLEMLPAQGEGPQLIDPGDGVDVARWLSTHAPVCSVIVHTTNTIGGDRMVESLQQGSWKVERIVPYGDLEWITERWRGIARELIVHGPCIDTNSDKAAKATTQFPYQESSAE